MVDLSQEYFCLADTIGHCFTKGVRRFFIEEHEARGG